MDVWIDYTNWRGERRWRHITPLSLVFTKTPHHPVHQWIIQAWCHEKEADRSFALAKVHEWRTEPPEAG